MSEVFDKLMDLLCKHAKEVYTQAYEDGKTNADIFDDGLDADIYESIENILNGCLKSDNTPEIVKKLWELYDKYEDAEHVTCADAAALLKSISEATE